MNVNLIKGMLVFFVCISLFTTGGANSPTHSDDRAKANAIGSSEVVEAKEAKITPKQLIENSMGWASGFNHYSCSFTKQERLEDGLSNPMTAEVKASQRPAAVRMEWEEGKVKVSLWKDGWDYVALNPRFWFPLNLKLDNKAVKKESLNPINCFGFTKSLNRIKVVLDSPISTEVKKIIFNKECIGYILIVNHKYKENNVEFNAITTVKFGKNFELQGTEQNDQNGRKFKYDWENLNTNIKLTDKDFEL